MLALKSSSSYKEFAQDNYCKQSIQVAERHILKNKRNIIWVDKDKRTVDEMQKLLKVNCLKKGEFDGCKGKRWLVAVDGSLSSYLALEECIKLADDFNDHVFVVTVRQKSRLTRKAKTMEDDVRLNFEMWKAARDIATSCQDRMKETSWTTRSYSLRHMTHVGCSSISAVSLRSTIYALACIRRAKGKEGHLNNLWKTTSTKGRCVRSSSSK